MLPRPLRRPRPGPGQESVWDYPRPPALERTGRRIRVVFAEAIVADSQQAWRVLETSHPPVYYLPAEDVRMDLLEVADGPSSFCEWKGRAAWYDVVAGGRRARRAAFSYPEPQPRFEAIAGHVAFYVSPMDACTVDDEVARPQPGSFYAGWITDDVIGPFKGEPGTEGW